MGSVVLAVSKRCLGVVVTIYLVACCFNDQIRSEALDIRRIYRGKVMTEEVVNLPADKVWAVYSSKDLPRLSVLLQPERFKDIEVLEGDGGVGTVIRMTLQPGFLGPSVLTDKFTKVDDKTMTKVLTQVKDGFLDRGFTSYIITYHITRKTHNSCAIKSTTVFHVKEGSEMNATAIIPNWKMAHSIVKYIANNYTIVYD